MALPASSVTSGKVATSDGSGGFTWSTPPQGVTTYAALTDVNVASLGDDSYMTYDSATSKWVVDNNLADQVQNLNTSGQISYANVTNAPTWYSTTGTVTSGTVSFTGLDDTQGWGYQLFFDITTSSINKNPYAKIDSISGAGTSSMSVTYSTDADAGTTCKLRILK